MKSTSSHDAQLNAAIQALDSKKAEQITVLDLGDRSSVARYFVIASGTSHVHLGAMRRSVEETWMKSYNEKLRSESRQGSPWQVIDAHDIMIHLFTPEERARYNLEGLWGDAKQVKVKVSGTRTTGIRKVTAVAA